MLHLSITNFQNPLPLMFSHPLNMIIQKGMVFLYFALLLVGAQALSGCKSHSTAQDNQVQSAQEQTPIASQLAQKVSDKTPADGPPGMVWIQGGDYTMGIDNDQEARADESPAHKVHVNGFWMDVN